MLSKSYKSGIGAFLTMSTASFSKRYSGTDDETAKKLEKNGELSLKKNVLSRFDVAAKHTKI
jgi:hypothetical protein